VDPHTIFAARRLVSKNHSKFFLPDENLLIVVFIVGLVMASLYGALYRCFQIHKYAQQHRDRYMVVAMWLIGINCVSFWVLLFTNIMVLLTIRNQMQVLGKGGITSVNTDAGVGSSTPTRPG
jgi:multisubunit Na+/H+ antiporter MnhE subunit